MMSPAREPPCGNRSRLQGTPVATLFQNHFCIIATPDRSLARSGVIMRAGSIWLSCQQGPRRAEAEAQNPEMADLQSSRQESALQWCSRSQRLRFISISSSAGSNYQSMRRYRLPTAPATRMSRTRLQRARASRQPAPLRRDLVHSHILVIAPCCADAMSLLHVRAINHIDPTASVHLPNAQLLLLR